MSNNRPPGTRPPERNSSRRDDEYYGDSSDRRTSRNSSARPSGSSASRSSGSSASRPSGSRGSSQPRSPQSGRSGSRPPARSGSKAPANRRRRRRSPLSLALPVILVLAMIVILALVLRSCLPSGGPDNSSGYALEFSPSQTLLVGETGSVTVSGLPEDFSGSIQWLSGDPGIVKVSTSGSLYAVNEGSAIISANVDKINVAATVKVIPMVEGVESVVMSQSSISIIADHSYQLLATYTLEGNELGSSASVRWTTSNASVARVNSDGLVYARDVGSATITATVGNRSDVCVVQVVRDPNKEPIQNTEGYQSGDDRDADLSNPDESGDDTPVTGDNPDPNTSGDGGQSGGAPNENGDSGVSTPVTVSSLALSPGFAYLAIGETMQVGATVVPSGTAVAWSSSNPAIATVSNDGVVTAKSIGTAVITASAGGHSSPCTVEVTPATDDLGQTQGSGQAQEPEPDPGTAD